ncbi:MAG: c-type cytochrome biogenesis protein CcmI [Alphaproteobacteria bacterium]|nr:c-type cytochrome biogenesis protein CcmI [Alphaproteobacteria bacterium]
MLYAVLALILAVVALTILWPLRSSRAGAEEEAGHIAIYREDAARIDAMAKAGEISPDEADKAREELERRVLAAAGDQAPQAADEPGRKGALSGPAVAVCVVAVLMIAGGGLYALMGRPNVPAQPAEGRLQMDLQQASLEELLERLQAELKREPDQLQGWLLLARTSAKINRAFLARHAYENALRLAPEDPEIRLEYADLLAAMEPAGKPAPQEALDIYQELWVETPSSPRIAMGLLSLYERNGQLRQALGVLEDLRERFPEGSPMRDQMSLQIERLQAELEEQKERSAN